MKHLLDWKFRASSLGGLMTNARGKDKLSVTAKNLCKRIFQEEVFGRSEDIKSKYLDKGIAQEPLSIALYSSVKGEPFFKNDVHFNNNYFTGTPDNVDGIVRDIKTSWSFATFPMYDKEIKTKAYIYQLQAYMDLTGLKEAELIYCMVDTPPDLIDDELRRLSWKSGCMSIDSMPSALVVETVQNLIYTEKGLEEYCHASAIDIDLFINFKELAERDRIRVFPLTRDDKLLDEMRERVVDAREYFGELILSFAD